MTCRSITHIKGATRAAAVNAEDASAPIRRPKRAVFHRTTWFGSIKSCRPAAVDDVGWSVVEAMGTICFEGCPCLPACPSDMTITHTTRSCLSPTQTAVRNRGVLEDIRNQDEDKDDGGCQKVLGDVPSARAKFPLPGWGAADHYLKNDFYFKGCFLGCYYILVKPYQESR